MSDKTREMLKRGFDCVLLLVLVYWAIVLTLFMSHQPLMKHLIGTSKAGFDALFVVEISFVIFVWTRMIGPGWKWRRS